jgi:hypothetical protein
VSVEVRLDRVAVSVMRHRVSAPRCCVYLEDRAGVRAERLVRGSRQSFLDVKCSIACATGMVVDSLVLVAPLCRASAAAAVELVVPYLVKIRGPPTVEVDAVDGGLMRLVDEALEGVAEGMFSSPHCRCSCNVLCPSCESHSAQGWFVVADEHECEFAGCAAVEWPLV